MQDYFRKNNPVAGTTWSGAERSVALSDLSESLNLEMGQGDGGVGGCVSRHVMRVPQEAGREVTLEMARLQEGLALAVGCVQDPQRGPAHPELTIQGGGGACDPGLDLWGPNPGPSRVRK